MSNDDTLTAFYRIFQGNSAFYVHHQKPFAEKEGKLMASWCGFAKYGTKSFPKIPEGFEDGDLVPVTKEHYREHLNGGNGIGIAPLLNTKDRNNVCYFAAIDIDVYDTTFTRLVSRLYQLGFKFAAFLSKSGGLHLYFFFTIAEPGEKVIEALNKIVEVFGLNRLFVNGKKKSKVEVFPKQATFIPGDKNANGIFLPFYNSKGGCKNKMLTAEGKLMGIVQAIPVIGSMFTSVKEIHDTLSNLPYSDAPFCIQTILLTGALAENDGRNNFLFSAAIYLKKKYRDGFEKSLLEEMNNCLEAPLEDKDVTSVYNSATDKEKNYEAYSCKKSPCSDYCDKRLCRLREFGPERDRNNRFTGANCWGLLTKYEAGGGKEPYYTWQVRIKEGEEFRTVHIDCHKDLLNQSAVQANCLRDLNWVPFTVKQNDWIDTVLKGLANIDDDPDRIIKVPSAADTTEMSMLRESFMKFLTHKQIQKNTRPYMVKTGQVYHADGAYYFDTRGLLDFLRMEKYSLGKFNLGTWLVDEQKCIQDAELTYETAKGERKSIKCWKKLETPELLGMDTFYEDMYESAADILQKNKLDKEDKEKDYGDNTKF